MSQLDPTTKLSATAEASTSPQASAQRKLYLSRNPQTTAIAVAFALLLFALEWYRHASYRSTAYDLAVFDQGLWLLAHGKVPFVTLIGRNLFLDHFSPVLVLFIPLYAMAATPLWLFLAQAAALGIGLLALDPLFDELGLSRPWKLSFTVAYLLSPLIWNAALFDFHPTTLSVPLLLMGITAALRDHRARLAWYGAGLLMVRFDLGLAVVALTVVGITRSRHRPFRAAVALLALGWVVFWGRVGIVGGTGLWHGYYGYVGSDPTAALLSPWRTVPRLFHGILQRSNLSTVFMCLLPLTLLPLLSPGRLLLATIWTLPLLAARYLAPNGLTRYHYGAVILPFLLLAAATGIRRLPRGSSVPAAALLPLFALSSFLGFQPVRTWIFDIPRPPAAATAEALRRISPGDAITVSYTMAPHVSHRPLLFPFPYPFTRGDEFFPLAPSVTEVSALAARRIDAVVVYLRYSHSRSVFEAFLSSPYLRTFRLVFDRDGLLVFRRVGR